MVELRPIEWLILSQLIAFALTSRVGLKLMTLPRLSGFIASCATNFWLKRLPLLHRRCGIERLCVLADLAARATYGSGRCLGRSLLIFWLLKARDQPAKLLVGVNKAADVFHAHAWIETEGRVIGDTPDLTEQFATLLRI